MYNINKTHTDGILCHDLIKVVSQSIYIHYRLLNAHDFKMHTFSLLPL